MNWVTKDSCPCQLVFAILQLPIVPYTSKEILQRTILCRYSSTSFKIYVVSKYSSQAQSEVSMLVLSSYKSNLCYLVKMNIVEYSGIEKFKYGNMVESKENKNGFNHKRMVCDASSKSSADSFTSIYLQL